MRYSSVLIAAIIIMLIAGIAFIAGRTDNRLSAPNMEGEVTVKYRFVAPNGTTVYELEPSTATALGYTSIEYYVGDIKISGDYIVFVDITVKFTVTDISSATVTFKITSGPGSPKSSSVSVTGSKGSKSFTKTASFDVGTVGGIFGSSPGTYTKSWDFAVSISGTGLDGKSYSASKSGSCSLTVTIKELYVPTPSIVISSVSGSVGYSPPGMLSIVRFLGF